MRPVEGLKAYQLSVNVAVRSCRIADILVAGKRYSVANQVSRAAISVPANIAEGYALGTRGQMVRTLRIALGSNEELRTHLEIVHRLEIVGLPLADLRRDAEEVTRMLVGLLKRYGARPAA